jgi:hypothetical protein
MTPWWNIGKAARAALMRLTADEAEQAAKPAWLNKYAVWGSVAGLTDGLFLLPQHIPMWRRHDHRFREMADGITESLVRRADELSFRRMAEGDRSALLARLQATRQSDMRRNAGPRQQYYHNAPPTEQELYDEYKANMDPRSWAASERMAAECAAKGMNEHDTAYAMLAAAMEAVGESVDAHDAPEWHFPPGWEWPEDGPRCGRPGPTTPPLPEKPSAPGV